MSAAKATDAVANTESVANAATTTCEHEWKLLDVSQETVGRYHDLYYGQGRRIERRRFFCSKCREVTTDESVTKGVGLRG